MARYGALSEPEDKSAAKRAYHSLLTSLEAWRATDYGALAKTSGPDRVKLTGALKEIRSLETVLDDLKGPGSVDQALGTLQSVGGSLGQVGATVAARAATQSESARQTLLLHQKIQAGLTLALLFIVLAWIWYLLRRNADLKRENQAEQERGERLARRLDHDGVTGLINHRIFAERVCAARRDLTRNQTLSVFCVDLESRLPTTVNFDQRAEDAVLAGAADLLRHAVDPLDTRGCLARAGGKGFLILTVSDEELGLTTADIADRIRAPFLRPIATEHGSFVITPAIGHADAHDADREPTDVIRNAELAACNAVTNGRRRVVAYQTVMRAEIERRAVVEGALARAVETNECLPHFQPQFNLESGRVFGVEALARWYHAELGWISPSEFIPIAEGNGDIVPLGWKIMETSCNEVQLLPVELTLSVNLSVAQILSDDVVGMLEECLARTGFPARRLKLEVTESTMMNDLKRIQETLSQLRALGIGISLDDFGVGYSALSYLTDFHWDEIKIDRSFAAKAVRDRKQRDVLKLVLGIAETMGSRVLVEGIETIEQRDALVEIGCKNGQGYLFGGPMAIDDITTLFFAEHSHRSLSGI
ncbi:putative bifunctional diguanylate cyclase/phosphodiesterase [Roseibium salinum]|uniref:putative bifunctional diguanylate cyclase/phosphodiesterase n=1 Tax=Roseibium salinum TaxID=1604349 RepID=UPI0036237EAA